MPRLVHMEQLRVLVVGAGLAGLALARALRQVGSDPEVIDRAAAWEVAGTGIYLPANGARALRALGLERTVADRGAEIGRQRVLDPRGRVLVDVDLHRFWGDVGPCLALHRAELHQVLREGVAVGSRHRGPRPRAGRRAGRGDLRRRPPEQLRPGRRGRRTRTRRSGG